MFRPAFRIAPAFAFAAVIGLSSGAARGETPPVMKAGETAGDSLGIDTTKTPSLAQPVRDSVIIPDSTWRWTQDARVSVCQGPLESLAQCWRPLNATPLPGVALLETGFPGVRARALNLRDFEPAESRSFFQPALSASPYGTGGQLPFARYESDAPSGLTNEAWVPVQPLDTPVTDLHWMRGALLMNQFGFTLHRMVGNRAYIGFDYLSNGAEGMFYDYAFQVHQPYLGAGRDSLSMVIEDTSHSIASRHVRPRVGYWVNANTVVEAWADWFSNSTSMANPTNALRNDSVQSLYPASFSATTFGGMAAHTTEAHRLQASFRHADWNRNLTPAGSDARREQASGLMDVVDAAWTLRDLPGAPRLTATVENSVHTDAFHTNGTSGLSTALPDASARGDREALVFDAAPRWSWFNNGIDGGGVNLRADVRASAERRARHDGVVEFLGGADADGRLGLPWGFALTGGAGHARTGAPEDLLFRWQPALGLYPNPDLAPRTHTRYGAGAAWETRHIGVGAAWERHRFDNTWLPRILPDPDACLIILDSAKYTGSGDFDAGCVGESLADSFALAHANYAAETRELLHLTAYLAAGNWRLTLRNTRLLKNTVEDPRLGFEAENLRIPLNVLKGQVLWKRVVLDGKLGLQTRWDWEWFSSRYEWASNGDGTSRVMPLDEYLALDYTAQMDIKSFSLYFRAMNLYHDRYATEPGVHPPGVNFRFGVDWRLRN